MTLQLLVATLACTGDSGSTSPEAAPAATAVPAVLIANSWQVRMAKLEQRSPFEGRASWVAYFGTRRDEALRAFVAENDPAATARAHAEFAAMYRQAALLAANATLQVYGADYQPTDPAEVSYLLGVSGALTNDAAQQGKLGSSGKSSAGNIAARDAAWATWAGQGPPDLPAGVDRVTGATGELPGAELATIDCPLQGEAGVVAAGDPGDLWALSRWHEARAKASDPAAADTIEQYLDPFRLPIEAPPERSGAAATDTWLFMSPYLGAADVQYVANVSQGRDTTEAMAASSAYAAVARACTRDSRLDVDCVVDEAAHVGGAIETAMAAANGGAADAFHRPFADYARAGVLRAMDLVARARGDGDASGRLRINALDRSLGAAADPVFYLFVAAWDAGNRNTPRAAEIVHQNLSLLPGLTIARAPLDALHIRLSRNAVPGVPMH